MTLCERKTQRQIVHTRSHHERRRVEDAMQTLNMIKQIELRASA